MLKNRKKKAFTIVELVIVIAVIAILAAVLIPTFSNIVDKANTSADIHIVKNLNTILAAEGATEGKNTTMTEALKDAEENGYTVEKLTPTNSNNKILWDSLNDCFVLLEKDAAKPNYCGVTPTKSDVKDYEYFKIYNTKSPLTVSEAGVATSDYSIYLGTGAIADSVTALTVSKGIDVGNNTDITSITYTNSGTAQDVVIRTNGGELIVNAGNDTVHHYDYAKTANIQDVDLTHSYHEHGTVGFTQIAKGHYVAEATAVVNTLLATGNGTEIKVDNNGGSIENAYTTDETAKEALHGGNENLEYNALEGITDSSTAEEKAEALNNLIASLKAKATMFARGNGTKNNPYIIADREQLENIRAANLNYKSMYDYACDLYYGDITTLEGNSLAGEWTDCRNYAYNGNNYLAAVNKYGWTTNLIGGYFKVADGVTEIDCSNWTSGYLYGHFDGNNVTLNNLDKALFNTVYDFESDDVPYEVSTISNFTANVNIRSSARTFEGLITNLGWSTSFKNVTVHGYIEAMNAASFVGLGTGYSQSGVGDAIDISFENCYSDVSLVASSGGCGGFVAHPYWGQGSQMIIKDSIFYGRMSSTSSNYSYYKVNSINDGTTMLEETYSEGFFSKYGYSSIEELRGSTKSWTAKYIVENKVQTLKVNSVDKPELGASFTVDQEAGAVKAVAKFIVGPNDVRETGNYTGVYLIDEDLTAVDGKFTSENVKYYTVTINGDSTTETGVSGTNLNIVNGAYGTTYQTYMVEFVQYDANGNIICITRCDLN